MFSGLKRSTRRLLMLLAALPTALLLLGTLYMLGMTHLEGTPRTFLEGLQWAAETLTTTGYGGDNHWRHPVMAVFVICGQFLGQFVVFLVFPMFMLPYFEERFEVRLAHVLPPMQGKVLFYRWGSAVEPLLEQMQRLGQPCVVLEEDQAVARTLHDRGFMVVHGQVGQEPAIVERVTEARAVVANGSDHANASFTMLARELGYTGPLFALASEPMYRAPMLRIGATEVLTPAHVLAAALASRASAAISPPVEGQHLLGQHLAFGEFRIHADSPLAGRTLGELHLRDTLGVSVIGQWREGTFFATHGPTTQLMSGAIVGVVGVHAGLERFERLAMPIRRDGPIVVAGFGAVGQKVVELLRDAGEQCRVIDQLPAPGVDVVGNVLDGATLERAGVPSASAVILALSDDGESVFATAAVRDAAPGVPMIVRVLRSAATPRLYRSGADFAISVGQVAGQVLAYHLLDQQEVGIEQGGGQGIKLVRATPGALAGHHPWHHEPLERTGAKVVALERAGQPLVEFDADFRVRPDDVLCLCGSAEALARSQRELGTGSPA